MKKLIQPLACAAVLFAALESRAQMAVEFDPSGANVILGRNSSTSSTDAIGVKGESKPAPNWGIGMFGDGGYIGVKGISSVSGVGTRYAGRFDAYGGQVNYGVFSVATSSSSSTGYGIYSSATGAGTNFAGYFAGNVYVTGTFTNPSDSRLKRDVRSLTGAVGSLMKLQPSSYYFDSTRIKMAGLPKSKQMGLIAEDVLAVFPELVSDVPVAVQPEEGKSAKPSPTVRSVNYLGLIPVLVAAIQEQQVEIAALKAALAKK